MENLFSYTMKLDGQNGEWVISGAEVKKTVDGNEVTTYDVADVYIEDGKLVLFGHHKSRCSNW